MRVTIHGRRREMGLGSATDVSLKEAREAAAHWRAVARSGRDPIRVHEQDRRDAERQLHLLADVAADAFETRKASLVGDGKAGRWFTPLVLHILPKLGRTPISEIDQLAIRDVIQPLWHTKHETARKALNRLGIVMKHAAALGLDVDLQAKEKAKALLGETRHVAKHHSAMPWQEAAAFYQSLNQGTLAQLALKLIMLTGSRMAPVRWLRLEHIAGDIWTVPGDEAAERARLKAKKNKAAAFRVPLSPEALSVVEQAKRLARGGWLFPGQGRKEPVISDVAIEKLMRGVQGVPHGFRATLRGWLTDRTDAPRDLRDAILAHAVGTQASRAYDHTSDALVTRRRWLELWAAWLTTSKDINYRADAAEITAGDAVEGVADER